MNFLRLPEVIKITGLSRSSIYSYIKQNKFPKWVSLGPRTSVWIDAEVMDWINARIEERDEGLQPLSLK